MWLFICILICITEGLENMDQNFLKFNCGSELGFCIGCCWKFHSTLVYVNKCKQQKITLINLDIKYSIKRILDCSENLWESWYHRLGLQVARTNTCKYASTLGPWTHLEGKTMAQTTAGTKLHELLAVSCLQELEPASSAATILVKIDSVRSCFIASPASLSSTGVDLWWPQPT